MHREVARGVEKSSLFVGISVFFLVCIALIAVGCPPTEPDPDAGPDPDPDPDPDWPPPLELTIHPTPDPPDPPVPDPPQNVRLTESLLVENLEGGFPHFESAVDVMVSDDGRFVYVSVWDGQPDVTMEVYSRDAKLSGLTFVQSFSAEVEFLGQPRILNKPQSAEIVLDGTFMILKGESEPPGAGRTSHIAILAIDQDNGTLTVVDHEWIAAANFGGLTIAPDDRDIYIGNRLYQLDPDTGALTEQNPPSRQNGRYAGAISPDGEFFYENILKFFEMGVIIVGYRRVYERDPDTGFLTLLSETATGSGESPAFMLMTPDGKFIYARSAPNTIGLFSRDADSGALTLIEDGITGLGGNIEFAPDGSGAIMAFEDEPRLQFFDYNSTTGALTPATSLVIGDDGDPNPLFNLSSLAFTPDGLTIYATARDQFAQFTRSLSDNALSFVGFEEYGRGGFEGLADVTQAHVSTDGRRVYMLSRSDKTTGDRDGSITLFERQTGGPELSELARYRGGIDGARFGTAPIEIAIADSEEAMLLGSFDNRNQWLGAFNAGPLGGLSEIVLQPAEIKDILYFAFVPGSNVFYAFWHRSVGIVGSFKSNSKALEILGNVDFDESVDGGYSFINVDESRKKLAVSANGENLYMTGYFPQVNGPNDTVLLRAIAHLKRNTQTNELASRHFHAFYDGVTNTSTPPVENLILAPDGNNIYMPAISSDQFAIVICDVDEEDGGLSNFRLWRTGFDASTGPTIAEQLLVTPDGQHLLALEREPVDPEESFGMWLTRIFRYNRDTNTGDIALDEIFETTALGRSSIGGPELPFAVSDPDDADPVVYIGAGDRLLGLDLN